jgi:hypothetical protein
MERRAYSVLLRVLFFSYTRRISGEGKPATTLELAGLASLRLSHTKAKETVNQDCHFNRVIANQLFFAALIFLLQYLFQRCSRHEFFTCLLS